MEKFRFISIDSVLSKFYRDARGNDLNETDLIEWAGEALEFMKLPSASEEAMSFVEVKDHHIDIPNRMHYIIQIARDNSWSKEDCKVNGLSCGELIVNSEIEDTLPIARDCDGNVVEGYSMASYSPYFDIQYNYENWVGCGLRERFTPVRLANHSLFGSLVCKGLSDVDFGRNTGEDEYTIVGDRIRFSFQSGFVAIPYIRQKVDEVTGYPMIPDNKYAKAAINYYLIWKMKERECWSHRQGSCQLAEKAQLQWESYIKKFRNEAKMPSGIDQHQNLMEGSRYLIPRLKRYYGFFGNLGTPEARPFNQPNQRRERVEDNISISTGRVNTTPEQPSTNNGDDYWDGTEW